MTPGQIKFFRINQGIPQYVLAERIGVSQTRICAIEHGKPPTAEEAARLRFALSIPPVPGELEANHAA